VIRIRSATVLPFDVENAKYVKQLGMTLKEQLVNTHMMMTKQEAGVGNIPDELIKRVDLYKRMLTKAKLPAYAAGGRITGKGGPKDDENLIRASTGEYMLPEDAASAIGYDTLDFMRAHKKIPGFATGGKAVRRFSNMGPGDNVYETDEEGKRWLVADGYLWYRYAKDATDVLVRDKIKNLSMEILVTDSGENDSIESFVFTGITLISTPAPTNVSIGISNFLEASGLYLKKSLS
jgi:hypothetical protein